MDVNIIPNVLHYGSDRCNRVTRSVMVAELLTLILGFDVAYVVRTLLEEVLVQSVRIQGFLDNRIVFDAVEKRKERLESADHRFQLLPCGNRMKKGIYKS